MSKKRNADLIIGLTTAYAIIAFALFERYQSSGTVPATAFFIAAATICLLPVLYGVVRHMVCKTKIASRGSDGPLARL